MMDAIDESRSALAGAIDQFKAAEAVYIAARKAADSAGAALHAALRQAAGPDLSPLIETQSKASLAASEALEALARANSATITRANVVVSAAAGAAMRIAIDDLAATDADVLAWRNCRNALIRDASAPLVGAGG
jgi:hypothetical protein